MDPGFLPKNVDSYDVALKQVCKVYRVSHYPRCY